MRSKVVIIISLLLFGICAAVLYFNKSSKKIDSYTPDRKEAYDYTIDNYSFYAEESTSSDVINVSNMLELLGLTDDVVVAETFLTHDDIDFIRDEITSFTNDVDYDMPVFYTNNSGSDSYYVYYDIYGVIHGIHVDKDSNLIELR